MHTHALQRECECRKCTMEPDAMICFELDQHRGDEQSLCIECVTSNNLYCAVCADVVLGDHARCKKDGYCICSRCLAEHQNGEALAGDIIASCEECHRNGVKLWPIEKRMACSDCMKSYGEAPRTH